MTSTALSKTGTGFGVDSYAKFQMSDGPNPGTAAISSSLMVLLPDPISATSDFITTPGTGLWSVEIYEVTAGVIGSIVDSATNISAVTNVWWVALDPAVFDVTKAYRVVIKDSAGTVCDEWDFTLFQPNIGAGAAGVSSINDAIRRIAGLLGYRRQVIYSDYILGIPQTTTIKLLDGAGAELASYRRKLVLDAAHAVIAETSAALDTNTL